MPKTKQCGLVPGVFDMSHPGHIEYLTWAKEQCDYLIAAVASDESVESTKGQTIFSFNNRVFILSSLRVVDIVTQYERGNLTALVKKLRPSILLQGDDRKPHLPNELKEYMENNDIAYMTHNRSQEISTSEIKSNIVNG